MVYPPSKQGPKCRAADFAVPPVLVSSGSATLRPCARFQGLGSCETVLQNGFDWRYPYAILIDYTHVSTKDQDTAGWRGDQDRKVSRFVWGQVNRIQYKRVKRREGTYENGFSSPVPCLNRRVRRKTMDHKSPPLCRRVPESSREGDSPMLATRVLLEPPRHMSLASKPKTKILSLISALTSARPAFNPSDGLQ